MQIGMKTDVIVALFWRKFTRKMRRHVSHEHKIFAKFVQEKLRDKLSHVFKPFVCTILVATHRRQKYQTNSPSQPHRVTCFNY